MKVDQHHSLWVPHFFQQKPLLQSNSLGSFQHARLKILVGSLRLLSVCSHIVEAARMNLLSFVLVWGWLDSGGEHDSGLKDQEDGHNKAHNVLTAVSHVEG